MNGWVNKNSWIYILARQVGPIDAKVLTEHVQRNEEK
jgi:hypothetical protein